MSAIPYDANKPKISANRNLLYSFAQNTLKTNSWKRAKRKYINRSYLQLALMLAKALRYSLSS